MPNMMAAMIVVVSICQVPGVSLCLSCCRGCGPHTKASCGVRKTHSGAKCQEGKNTPHGNSTGASPGEAWGPTVCPNPPGLPRGHRGEANGNTMGTTAQDMGAPSLPPESFMVD